MRKEVWFAIIGILIIIIGFWYFFRTKSCDADYCFEEATRDCSKTKITITDEDGSTFYNIMGKEGDNCRLYIQIKTMTGLNEDEPEARKEYIERLDKIRKGKFVRIDNFAKRYGL